MLILSVPVACKHRNEFRTDDTYNLGLQKNEKGEVFFQRVYDAESLQAHIIMPLMKWGARLQQNEVWGWNGKMTFDHYLYDVKQRGQAVTIKSAYHASKYMRKYHAIQDLPDRGVWCGCFARASLNHSVNDLQGENATAETR